jgi:hypothetical protein
MKRITLFLLCGLLFSAYVIAQEDEFTQGGKATQELQAEGFFAAHPSRPISSKVMVVNVENGKEVEVTIIGRIPSSSSRIIDLSPDVWRELELNENTPIVLYLNAPSQSDQMVVEVKQEPVEEPMPVVPEPAAPVIAAEKEIEPPRPVSPLPSPSAPPPPPPPPSPPRPAPPPVNPSVSRAFGGIEVIPCLPNPNTRKIYRLQIGSYLEQENAVIAVQLLRNAGFNVAQERYGAFHRVLAVGIPAAEVASVIRKMESMGIKQVWIRE